MTENELNEILQYDDLNKCIEKLKEIFSDGFDINEQDIKLKNKLDSFIEETDVNNYDIPIQLKEKDNTEK